ncbi:MAG: flagellar hook-length control protein FliK [Candidatus Sumerlaeota bacterium]|nr:flagellar hook-length control protein FliK [Candidatus Sumerlaeota bacterium]
MASPSSLSLLSNLSGVQPTGATRRNVLVAGSEDSALGAGAVQFESAMNVSQGGVRSTILGGSVQSAASGQCPSNPANAETGGHDASLSLEPPISGFLAAIAYALQRNTYGEPSAEGLPQGQPCGKEGKTPSAGDTVAGKKEKSRQTPESSGLLAAGAMGLSASGAINLLAPEVFNTLAQAGSSLAAEKASVPLTAQAGISFAMAQAGTSLASAQAGVSLASAQAGVSLASAQAGVSQTSKQVAMSLASAQSSISLASAQAVAPLASAQAVAPLAKDGENAKSKGNGQQSGGAEAAGAMQPKAEGGSQRSLGPTALAVLRIAGENASFAAEGQIQVTPTSAQLAAALASRDAGGPSSAALASRDAGGPSSASLASRDAGGPSAAAPMPASVYGAVLEPGFRSAIAPASAPAAASVPKAVLAPGFASVITPASETVSAPVFAPSTSSAVMASAPASIHSPELAAAIGFKPMNGGDASLKTQKQAENKAPVSTTPVAPVSTTPVAPNSTTPVAPNSTTPVAPVSTTPVAPVSTTPVAPNSTTPVAPNSTTAMAPVSAMPVAPVSTAAAAPVSAMPVAPVSTTAVAPVSTTPVAPDPATPAAANAPQPKNAGALSSAGVGLQPLAEPAWNPAIAGADRRAAESANASQFQTLARETALQPSQNTSIVSADLATVVDAAAPTLAPEMRPMTGLASLRESGSLTNSNEAHSDLELRPTPSTASNRVAMPDTTATAESIVLSAAPGSGAVEGASERLNPKPPEPLVSQIVEQTRRTLAVYPERRAATFQISPPELGKVTVEIVMKGDNTAQAVIQAHTARGHEALMRNAPQLSAEFERQGLPQPQVSFAGSYSHTNANPHQQSNQSAYMAFDDRQMLWSQRGQTDARETGSEHPSGALRLGAEPPGLGAWRRSSGRINLTA